MANVELTLEASGLPVSLSAGQQGIVVALKAKNASLKPVSVSFTVSLADSDGKQVEAAVEPRVAMLEGQGEAEAEVKFGLKESAARGPLTLSAYVSENAMYIDKPSAKSNIVAITSQVKLPMRLEYRRGSACFERQENGAEALCLTFDNLGESGGQVGPKSSALYGKEKELERAQLFESVKVKGKEKGVRLKFMPAKKIELERVEAELVGVDANGKPYNLKQVLEGKARTMKKKEK
ncbi:Uncharacterised protein [uncultured archaeon]|nr:Uncharacterised protein [uncultured archaeon]